ncbi:non-structural maintenance of chromosomes element 3 homolog isoform X1 [Cotesia typhae]|uniref:non-structural maintenance of chromosomes element 3 homolog isoform X1 n=1 Tax=Cotesia typhae TaxID=2053667 RepID=UPI003D694E78
MSQRARRQIATQQAPADNLDLLASRVIKYLLEKSHKKYPVKASDIKKFVLGKHAEHFRPVMVIAKDRLRKIFGYNLVNTTGAQYFIINMIVNEHLKALPRSDVEAREQTLLFLVLSFIFMCAENNQNAIVVEDELWEFFMNLNIISEDESQHSYFGNVKSLISDKFVKQLYLIKSKQRETDSVLFEWGPRANYELDRKSVLKFVSKIYNCPMENFVKQYKAMKVYERSALRE